MLLQLAIPVLVGLSVILIGAAAIVFFRGRREPLEARLREIEGGAMSLGGMPGAMPLRGVLDRVGHAVSSKGPSTLKQELASAGFHSRAAPTIYLGTKIVLLAFGLIVFSTAVMYLNWSPYNRFMMAGCGALVLFFLPNLYVANCRTKRRTEVRVHLPDAIDLLEISVSAGMGLDQAWNSVAAEVRNVSATLADEMALANLEIQLGASRAVAMRHMADRTDSRDLSSLVAILVQSERFGTSVSEALRTFSNAMRETRSMRAQEYAEKMAVKLIFPMVLLIFPAVVIVMAGPGFMSLIKALKVAK
jgi:tight adherence protein C